jgi:lipid-binding SYLF domain-containing protein
MKRGLLCLVAALPLLADRQSDNLKRIDAATTDLMEMLHAKDGGIPEDIMQKAHCVGIIPGMKRAGLIVGAHYGKGLLTCRIHGSNHWSPPSMVVLDGGSIGLQIGAGETDVVFAVMNASGEKRLTQDKFTLGGEAAVMAGPVGRDAKAQTDAMMTAEILSWSRAHGVFAGVDLSGASLRPDHDDNRALYGRDASQQQILHGDVPVPEAANRLYTELERYAFRESRTGGF